MGSRFSSPLPLFILVVVVLFRPETALAFSVSPSSSSGPYCLNVQFDVQPDRRESFLQAISNDAKEALTKEEHCLQYVLGEDVTTSNRFHLHEQYRSFEDFQEHQRQAYYKEWKEFGATGPWKPGTTPLVQFYQGTHAPVKKRSPTPAYCLNVQLCIQPEVRDEFLRVIQQNQKGSTQDEPLCLQYDWGESTTEANTFYFHEQYTGLEGFKAHAKAPHFLKWEEFAATDPFTSPPLVQFYESIPIV